MAKIKSAETGRYTTEANSETTYKESRRKITVPDAVKTLAKALREDKEFYFVYQSNIAMSMYNAMLPRISTDKPIEKAELHLLAGEGAKKFLDLWIAERESRDESRDIIRKNKTT
ncbi:MAG TPA: hypothetical protein VNI84_18830 [Pyrinomonadaceae bacterium]|nr:hypothetical protein [Pyrinomonadaceae bacterium]